MGLVGVSRNICVGEVNVGHVGELAARLLLLFARDSFASGVDGGGSADVDLGKKVAAMNEGAQGGEVESLAAGLRRVNHAQPSAGVPGRERRRRRCRRL